MKSRTINFDTLNSSFAHDVISKSKASSACLFLFDQDQDQVSFIYNEGIPLDITNLYVSSVYQYDPLLPHPTSLIRDCKTYTGTNYVGMKLAEERQEKLNHRYWKALGNAGFKETAASVHAISNNIFLVVGLLLEDEKRHLCVDSAMNSIENWLEEGCEHIIESSIRQCHSQVQECNTSNQLVKNMDVLTNRETQVVYELLQGCSNKTIGNHLNLSEYTIENHLRRIYKKFDVHTRSSLLAKIYNERNA